MEASLKVKRITRDIPLYQEGQAAFEVFSNLITLNIKILSLIRKV